MMDQETAQQAKKTIEDQLAEMQGAKEALKITIMLCSECLTTDTFAVGMVGALRSYFDDKFANEIASNLGLTHLVTK